MPDPGRLADARDVCAAGFLELAAGRMAAPRTSPAGGGSFVPLRLRRIGHELRPRWPSVVRERWRAFAASSVQTRHLWWPCVFGRVCCSTLQQAEAGDRAIRVRRPATSAAPQFTRSTGDPAPLRRRHTRTFSPDPSHLARLLAPSLLATAQAAVSSAPPSPSR